MRFLKTAAIVSVLALTQICWTLPTAEAGPLLDWMRGLRNKSCLNRNASTWGNPNQMACLQPGQCQVTCQQTCSRTVVNYVPQTAYRTSWEKVPVTQYRPVTNTDPCTGCTVTCMKPCTSYTWQMKQVPYTTYRPVYRQETYKVPVTYVTQDCNSCNTCPTCEVPASMPPSIPTTMSVPGCTTCNISPTMTMTPSTSYVVPSGTIGSTETYTSGPSMSPTPAITVPADLSPEINPNSYQRRVLDGAHNVTNFNAPPPRSAENPIMNTWDYSPVRLASHATPITEWASPAATKSPVESESFGSFRPAATPRSSGDVNANAGWKSQSW
ncbi:MAG: hypothetical protein KF851_02345 [Pirellulaceae bacterium]|jgi:hypothetical protein|nr:hypothetical protein [Pirellulaceae bacterium]